MWRIARCREQVGLFEPSRGVVIIFGRTSVRGGANLVAQRTCQLFTQHFSPPSSKAAFPHQTLTSKWSHTQCVKKLPEAHA